MTNRNKEISPILFVTGAPRSGTTLVSRVLRWYYGFGMGPEGHWIVPYAKRLAEFGDLRRDSDVTRLIDAILAEEMFQIVRERYQPVNGRRVDVTRDMVWPLLPNRTYGGVVYAVLDALARQLDRELVGNKNPNFVHDLDVLDTHFPNANYLLVVRDGRDVALSMMKQAWGQKSWYANARFWAHASRCSEQFLSRIPEDRRLHVKYEDLLTNTADVSVTIETFLGTPLSPLGRSRLVEELRVGERSDNFGKWRKEMSARDHRLFEAAAGEWLDHYGYERTTSNPVAFPWEKAYFMSLEFARRAKNRVRSRLKMKPAS